VRGRHLIGEQSLQEFVAFLGVDRRRRGQLARPGGGGELLGKGVAGVLRKLVCHDGPLGCTADTGHIGRSWRRLLKNQRLTHCGISVWQIGG
jgi:hypothetical protein